MKFIEKFDYYDDDANLHTLKTEIENDTSEQFIQRMRDRRYAFLLKIWTKQETEERIVIRESIEL